MERKVYIYDVKMGEIYEVDFVDDNLTDRVDININTESGGVAHHDT